MNTETKNEMNERICNDFIKNYRSSNSGNEQNELAIQTIHLLLRTCSIEELIEKGQTDKLYDETLYLVYIAMQESIIDIKNYCGWMTNFPHDISVEELVKLDCCRRVKSWNEETFCRLYENLKFLAVNNHCKIVDLTCDCYKNEDDPDMIEYVGRGLKVPAAEKQIQLYNNWKEYWRMIREEINVETVFGCPELDIDDNGKMYLKK